MAVDDIPPTLKSSAVRDNEHSKELLDRCYVMIRWSRNKNFECIKYLGLYIGNSINSC